MSTPTSIADPRASSADDVPATLDAGPAPRNLGLLDQLGMWGNLGISLLGFAGAIVVLQPDGQTPMGLLPAVLALITGTLIGTAGVSAMALAGSQQGQPAMVLLRGLFGGRLSYIPTVINAFQLIGWGTFEIVTMTLAVRAIWDVPNWPVVVLIGIASTLLALYPLRWVKVLRKYVTAAVVLVLAYLAVQLSTNSIPAYHGHGWHGFVLAVDTIIGLAISWVPVAGDYARHSTSNRNAVLGSYLGYCTTQIAVYCIGIMTLLLARSDTEQVFLAIVGVTGGTFCFAVLALREIDQCFVDVYSTTVSIQNLRPRWDRRIISIVIGALSTVLALAIDIYGFSTFLGLIGSVFVPLLGVFVVDYYAFGRRHTWNTNADAPARPLMLLPWLAGFLAYQFIAPAALGWWHTMWADAASAVGFTAPSWMSASISSFIVAAAVTAIVDGISTRPVEQAT